jgi:hypothetical protein
MRIWKVIQYVYTLFCECQPPSGFGSCVLYPVDIPNKDVVCEMNLGILRHIGEHVLYNVLALTEVINSACMLKHGVILKLIGLEVTALRLLW